MLLFPFHVMVSWKVSVFSFLPVVLQLMVNISAWHKDTCSCNGHGSHGIISDLAWSESITMYDDSASLLYI